MPDNNDRIKLLSAELDEIERLENIIHDCVYIEFPIRKKICQIIREKNVAKTLELRGLQDESGGEVTCQTADAV